MWSFVTQRALAIGGRAVLPVELRRACCLPPTYLPAGFGAALGCPTGGV